MRYVSRKLFYSIEFSLECLLADDSRAKESPVSLKDFESIIQTMLAIYNRFQLSDLREELFVYFADREMEVEMPPKPVVQPSDTPCFNTVCPLEKIIMFDPVVNPVCGHGYEKEAIIEKVHDYKNNESENNNALSRLRRTRKLMQCPYDRCTAPIVPSLLYAAEGSLRCINDKTGGASRPKTLNLLANSNAILVAKDSTPKSKETSPKKKENKDKGVQVDIDGEPEPKDSRKDVDAIRRAKKAIPKNLFADAMEGVKRGVIATFRDGSRAFGQFEQGGGDGVGGRKEGASPQMGAVNNADPHAD